MEPTPAEPALPPSRRARREAELAASRGGRRRSAAPAAASRSTGRAALAPSRRWVPRAAVLGTLAAATIAMPLTAAARGDGTPFELPELPVGPTTLDLVTSPVAAPATSDSIAAAPRSVRADTGASRSAGRDAPLPDCDGSAPVVGSADAGGSNGKLDDHALCDLWQAGESLQPAAAVSLSALNESFRATFGRDLCLVASYRSLSEQYAVKSNRGSFAARPGTSMHGWGLAIDLCSKETGNRDVYRWLNENGPLYGWQNPPWAKRGGSGSYEPWHFEYVDGVKAVGGWVGA